MPVVLFVTPPPVVAGALVDFSDVLGAVAGAFSAAGVSDFFSVPEPLAGLAVFPLDLARESVR